MWFWLSDYEVAIFLLRFLKDKFFLILLSLLLFDKIGFITNFVNGNIDIKSVERNGLHFNRNISLRTNFNNSNPVPLITISMNNDPKKYLVRLLKSIDYPVRIIRIQIGNSDKAIVDGIVNQVVKIKSEYPNLNIEYHTLPYNPGASKGFNYCLRYMLESKNTSWGLVLNNDIAFYPGILRKIANNVEFYLKNDRRFGIGFTSLCCGGAFSALTFTKRMVEVVGLFDENFYPAYFEDDDYSIRVHLSHFKARQFDNTPLLHGENDGSKSYVSGLVDLLYYHPIKNKDTDRWRVVFEKGVKRSGKYFDEKWGQGLAHRSNEKNKVNCKTSLGINHYCKDTYLHPFNNSNYNISYWELRKEIEENFH